MLILNHNNLRPGDVILTSSNSTLSLFIRIGTFGNFSHAMIVANDSYLVDAVSRGVRTVAIDHAFVGDEARIRILRYRDSDIAREAAHFANNQIGSEYSTAQAVLSAAPLNLRISDCQKTFCSALVAGSFAGAKASEFLRRKAYSINPNTLWRMKRLCFIDVTRSGNILSKSDEIRPHQLDGPNIDLFSDGQTSIHRKIGRQLSGIILDIETKYPLGRVGFPSTYFGALDLLARMMFFKKEIPDCMLQDFEKDFRKLDKSTFDAVRDLQLEDHLMQNPQRFISETEDDWQSRRNTVINERENELAHVIRLSLGRSLAFNQYFEIEHSIIESLRQNSVNCLNKDG